MMNSSNRIDSHNTRDEWTLAIIAVVLPLVSLLSITL